MRVDIFNDNHMYDLLYIDPPWKQSKGGKKKVRENSSGKELDYNTCTLDEIEEHIKTAVEITNTNSVVFLWSIDKYLHESEEMMKRLGYKLHARMIWNKVNGIPAAFTIRYGHEYLLWFYRGKLLPIEISMRGKIHSVFTEKVVRHSQKPIIARHIIDSLYPTQKKLEMYARQKFYGWDCWGNDDELDNPNEIYIKPISIEYFIDELLYDTSE